MKLKVFSWHPVLTDHQIFTLEAMAKCLKAELRVCVSKKQDSIREEQGWSVTESKKIEIDIIPQFLWPWFSFKCLTNNKNAIHLFGSPFEQPKLIIALFVALFMGLEVYLIAEPYSPIAAGYLSDKGALKNRIKSLLRPFLYKVYGYFLRKRLSGVFAISSLAVRQYKSMGVPDSKIHPFGYFVPKIEPTLKVPDNSDPSPGKCKIIFVGNLIHRKGLDLLINAANKTYEKNKNFYIDIYGHGNPDLFAFNNTYIRYRGKIPFGNAQSVIANYDLLVLPSRYDGWGVVVNEAILAGIPVVCSADVGASLLVRRIGCGIVYKTYSEDELADVLLFLSTHPNYLERMAHAAINYQDCLSPVIAGAYMANSITSSRVKAKKPDNPWY